jgi:hypothetical protein
LEHKLKKREFPVKGPLDENDIAVYDRGIADYKRNRSYAITPKGMREALMVDYALHCVYLYNKYEKNGRRC